jgi:hypothetical protein
MPCAQYRHAAGTGWTVAEPTAQTGAMLPWNSVEKLRDHFGEYVILVTCRSCRHSREVMPAFLARHCRGGWDEPLANIIGRFRCRCGKKSVEVQIGFDRKPRGWVKNPS